MGAGSNYTISNGSKAIWIPIEHDIDPWQYQENGQHLKEDIGNQLEILNYKEDNKKEKVWYNGLVEVIIKSTYYGDAYYLDMQPLDEIECCPEYNLAIVNMDKMYNKIKNHFAKVFSEVRIATSGWTSTNVSEMV